MLYANVSPEDIEKLEQELKQTKDAKWYQRLKIIQFSSQGRSVPELGSLFERCTATIREYITKYNTGGIENLKAASHEGASAKIPLSKAEWDELLRRSPSQFEQLNTAARNWSQELLVDYFQRYYTVTVDQSTISKTMKRLGLRWNRGALKVTSPDPLYTVKRQRIDALKKKAVEGTLTSHDAPKTDKTSPPKPAKLVFCDSTDIHWCPDVGYSYVSQGMQVRTESPGKENPWYALFGSLIYPFGEGVYTIHERKRHQEVQAHLEALLESEPETFFFVIMDGASAHTTPKLDAFWEEQRESLCRVSLPTYSPHLNLIERLWRLMRGQMTRDQFYQSLKDEAKAIVEWLEKLPFSTFCSLMGIDETQLIFV